VLVAVANHGSAAVTAPLVLDQNGTVLRQEPITVPAGSTSTVLWPIGNIPGIVTARLDLVDGLASDNTRALVVPASGPIRVHVIAARHFVEAALSSYPDLLRVSGPAGSETTVPDRADVIVCDGCSDIPPGEGGVLILPASASPAAAPVPLTMTALEHPVGNALTLDGLVAVPVAVRREVDETAIVARAGALPAIAAYVSRGRRIVEIRLDPQASGLGLETAFPMLIASAIEWLAVSHWNPLTVVAGEPLRWLLPGAASEPIVTGPAGERIAATFTGGVLTIAHARSAGRYRVQVDGQEKSFVVNPAVVGESDLRSVGESGPDLNVRSLGTFQREITMFLLMAALGILAFESYLRYRPGQRHAVSARAS
jgi:hypothetical protein